MARTRVAGGAAGFTLIEVMISMFFLAFIVGEMAMISTYARRSTAFAQRLTEANMFAEAVLEKSRNTAWNNLATRFSALDTPPDPIVFDLNKDGVVESYNETCVAGGTVTTCTAVAGAYTIERTVTQYLPTAGAAFTSATTAADLGVTVRWTDAKGVAQQVRVATVRAKF
ncbi:MAG TPA: prepilin-type N-terminal cleavage/methylation domain-containing protein [bacterium]